MSTSFASNSNLRGAQRGAALTTATSSFVGVVRVDATTLQVDANGTISVDPTALNNLSSTTATNIANLSSTTATNIATTSSYAYTNITTLSSNTATAIQNVGTRGFAYFQPVYFNASANAGTLTVSNSTGNTTMIKVGAQFTSGATLYTITALGSGSGGNGTYTISPANTFGSAGFIITQWIWSTPANIYTAKLFAVGAGGGGGGGGGSAVNTWYGNSAARSGGAGGSGGNGKRALKYIALNQNTSYSVTVGRKGYAGTGGASFVQQINGGTVTGTNGTSGTSAIGNTTFGNIISATPGTFGGAGGRGQSVGNSANGGIAGPNGTDGTTSSGDFTWFNYIDATLPIYNLSVSFGGGGGGGAQTGDGSKASPYTGAAGGAGSDGNEGILIIEF
jgi:hypothetical protein